MESDNKTSAVSHACAACKYQRRKCKPDCLLAPFFPASSHLDFLAVHKLFGVSNILKTIRSFDSPPDKQAAVKSMIFHAKSRAADPVGGCYRIICQLKNQISFYEKQLLHVRQQVDLHKLIASQFSRVHHDDSMQSFSAALLGEKQNKGFDEGNYETPEVFDGISVKFENEERVSQSSGLVDGCDNESFVVSSQPDKQLSVTVDLSEDVKPFVGVFDDRFNSVFIDSKSSYRDKVLLEDHN
ncbi:LOB domain-containing protein 22 [Euphorbia peplus]|nr:LOB domain-containing protein 22 [Euphorbia peplus]